MKIMKGGDDDDYDYGGHHGDNLSNEADSSEYSEWWMDDDDFDGHRITVIIIKWRLWFGWWVQQESRGWNTFTYPKKKVRMVRARKNKRESEKEGESRE